MKTLSGVLKQKGLIEEQRGLQRIPGTNKVRTYVGNPNQYSKESDLEKITAKQYRAAGARKKI